MKKLLSALLIVLLAGMPTLAEVQKSDKTAKSPKPAQVPAPPASAQEHTPWTTGPLNRAITREAVRLAVATDVTRSAVGTMQNGETSERFDWSESAAFASGLRATAPACEPARLAQVLSAPATTQATEAIDAMVTRGLQIQTLTPQAGEEWQQMAEPLYPTIHGTPVPAGLFDDVTRLVSEHRAV